MAAITKCLLHLRPRHHHPNPYPLHHFSTSSDPDRPSATPQPESDRQDSSTQSPLASYFDDVKASLHNQPPPQNRPQTPPKPLSFSNRNPTPPQQPPSKTASIEEIRRNLSEFRLRAAPPPPSSSPDEYTSMQELYNRNVRSQADDSATSTPTAGGKLPFDVIRQSIRQIKPNRNDSGGRPMDPLSLSRFKENFKLKSDRNSNLDTGMFIGGSYNDNVGSKTGAMGTEFMRLYNHQDLGKKLKMLRPEKKKGKWFSLQELNERLFKLREIEEKEKKESEAKNGAVDLTRDLRESLVKLALANAQKTASNPLQGVGLFGHLGGTPSYMSSPPKEELVEKYFHPDNMSSAEKLKLELKKVRDEFKMSESDCGSARVQVAQLTTKIKHLSNVLQKKDKHSRKGLQDMVQRRKRLLKYLRRTDWDSYCLVLSKLGLRDNPDIKA